MEIIEKIKLKFCFVKLNEFVVVEKTKLEGKNE